MTSRTPALLEGVSVEMTARDRATLDGIELPAATPVSVTHLGSESEHDRVAAAAALAWHGLEPVVHVAARRVPGEAALTEHLAALRATGATQVFAVAGDPRAPRGPYADSLALIRSGLLAEHGFTRVGIGGYPDGHPAIPDHVLWESLRDKSAALADQGLAASITTQFSFDAQSVLRWVEQVRDHAIDAPIRVGVAGPAGVARLVGFARRCGVATSAGIALKYGFSLGNLLGTATPDRFVAELAAHLDPAVHGEVRLHVFAFGDLAATSAWVTRAE
ncbi:methylenetetrahydrofolate reductase [Demequina pelophila]|uniref:methylenetetrahydrofolate reductase n=1 Tax=Demequina pelophila TaxID=1638984 RepID=UPI0007817141|nr:methylenetetrahydrofolate reductase [Demequina pelophila]